MESDKAQAQALLMFNCVHQGHFNVLRKLLKAGANPNVFDAEGEPLIFIPVVNGDYETLEVLLESGKYILIQASHKPDPFSLVLFLQELNRIFCCFYTDILENFSWNYSNQFLLFCRCLRHQHQEFGLLYFRSDDSRGFGRSRNGQIPHQNRRWCELHRRVGEDSSPASPPGREVQDRPVPDEARQWRQHRGRTRSVSIVSDR